MLYILKFLFIDNAIIVIFRRTSALRGHVLKYFGVECHDGFFLQVVQQQQQMGGYSKIFKSGDSMWKAYGFYCTNFSTFLKSCIFSKWNIKEEIWLQKIICLCLFYLSILVAGIQVIDMLSFSSVPIPIFIFCEYNS